MKRVVIIVAAIIFSFQFSTFNPVCAQQPEDGVARHAVKFNLLSPLASSLDFNYEYRIANRSAVAFDLGGNLLKPMSRTMTPHVVFMQAQYRFYLCSQRRNGVMPFLGVGINYTRSWEHFDCFTGNDGWDIHLRRYTEHDNVLSPSFAFGLRVNIPFGLTLENTLGFVAGNLLNDGNELSNNQGVALSNYLGPLFSMRIGWAF